MAGDPVTARKRGGRAARALLTLCFLFSGRTRRPFGVPNGETLKPCPVSRNPVRPQLLNTTAWKLTASHRSLV